MELWDIYDKDRIKTNKTIVRGDSFNEDEYHLVVHVCIFNKDNKMLIQQRQPFKQGWPNLWDLTVGGSAVAGDTSQLAAQREVFEEIGYQLDLTNIRPHLTINFEVGFDDYYLIETEIELDKLTLQYEEVQQVSWATQEEILQLIDDGKFIPYDKSFIELLFAIRHNYGSIIR